MKEVKFIVTGKEKLSKVSQFMKAMDLGIEGIYKSFRDVVSGKVEDNFNQPEVEDAMSKIKKAYEENGCVDVLVTLVSLEVVEPEE